MIKYSKEFEKIIKKHKKYPAYYIGVMKFNIELFLWKVFNIRIDL